MSTDITVRGRALKCGGSARPPQQFFHAWKYVFSTACAAWAGSAPSQSISLRARRIAASAAVRERLSFVRTGRHVVHNLHVHLVFVTKYRRKAFTDEMLTRCEEIMREVCQDFRAELKQFNGGEGHVHLLVHYPPSVQLSRLVNSLKGVSSRYPRKEYDAHVRRYLWAAVSGPARTSPPAAAGHH